MLNIYEIEKQIMQRFVLGVIPNLQPKFYMSLDDFINCYNNNIKPYIDNGNYNIPISKICGLYVVDVQKFQSGQLIKELVEDQNIIVPLFLVSEFKNTSWQFPNVGMQLNFINSVYSHYLIDKTGVINNFTMGNLQSLIYYKFIQQEFLVATPNHPISTATIFKSISGISVSTISQIYSVNSITITFKLLNC